MAETGLKMSAGRRKSHPASDSATKATAPRICRATSKRCGLCAVPCSIATGDEYRKREYGAYPRGAHSSKSGSRRRETPPSSAPHLRVVETRSVVDDIFPLSRDTGKNSREYARHNDSYVTRFASDLITTGSRCERAQTPQNDPSSTSMAPRTPGIPAPGPSTEQRAVLTDTLRSAWAVPKQTPTTSGRPTPRGVQPQLLPPHRTKSPSLCSMQPSDSTPAGRSTPNPISGKSQATTSKVTSAAPQKLRKRRSTPLSTPQSLVMPGGTSAATLARSTPQTSSQDSPTFTLRNASKCTSYQDSTRSASRSPQEINVSGRMTPGSSLRQSSLGSLRAKPTVSIKESSSTLQHPTGQFGSSPNDLLNFSSQACSQRVPVSSISTKPWLPKTSSKALGEATSQGFGHAEPVASTHAAAPQRLKDRNPTLLRGTQKNIAHGPAQKTYQGVSRTPLHRDIIRPVARSSSSSIAVKTTLKTVAPTSEKELSLTFQKPLETCPVSVSRCLRELDSVLQPSLAAAATIDTNKDVISKQRPGDEATATSSLPQPSVQDSLKPVADKPSSTRASLNVSFSERPESASVKELSADCRKEDEIDAKKDQLAQSLTRKTMFHAPRARSSPLTEPDTPRTSGRPPTNLNSLLSLQKETAESIIRHQLFGRSAEEMSCLQKPNDETVNADVREECKSLTPRSLEQQRTSSLCGSNDDSPEVHHVGSPCVLRRVSSQFSRVPPPTPAKTSLEQQSSTLDSKVPSPPVLPDSYGRSKATVSGDTLKDPACNPDDPYVLQFMDVTSAAFMIGSSIPVTPCVHSRLSEMAGMDVFMKKDFMQVTGSFKERGARYALMKLTPDQQKIGIVAASLGNHALALSCHGAQLGIPVTVVMPHASPLAKISACRSFGANVVVQGADMVESRNIALMTANECGLTYINGYDHPHIIAGQGTLGLEMMEQVKNVDAVVIPVGGGGLLSGVAVAVKEMSPDTKIIAVESDRCPSFSSAIAAGKPVWVNSLPTIADGLAVPLVGVNSFASAGPLVDRTIVVNEDLIALSILRIAEIEKNVVEGAGAVGLAALISGQMDDFKGKRVVVLASGGNIDVTMLSRCLERGLVSDGRLLCFTVFTDQSATSVAALCSAVESVGGSVKDMTHVRTWEAEDFFKFPVRVICETPGVAQALQLRNMLIQQYQKVIFHHNGPGTRSARFGGATVLPTSANWGCVSREKMQSAAGPSE